MDNLLPDQVPPQPGSPFRPMGEAGEAARIKLTCHPSLSTATTIPASQHSVKFVVCIESDLPAIQKGNELQVHVWHNHNGPHDWNELRLWRSQKYQDLLMVKRASESRSKLWYEGELTGLPKHGHQANFTVRFKFQVRTTGLGSKTRLE